MRKVTIKAEVNITLNVDDDANLTDVIFDLDVNAKDQSGKADVEDITIEDWQVTDSR